MMKFSMKSMILFVSGLSVYLATVFALPIWLSMPSLMLITLVMPAIYISGILYARGAWRAFWIGSTATAIIPQIAGMYYAIALGFSWYAGMEDVFGADSLAVRLSLAATQTLPLLGGLVALVMRRIYR